MKTVTKTQLLLLGLLFLYSFLPSFGGLLRVIELSGVPGGNLVVLPPNTRASAAPITVTLHVVTSVIFCIQGAIQFLPDLRPAHPKFHRVNGYVVALSGVLCAATGVWMTESLDFPAELQGNVLYWARMVLGMSMMGFIVSAVSSAWCGENLEHKANMVRAYAIGQGASTQVVLGMVCMALTGAEPHGALRDGIMVLAWVINLYLAEFLIAHTVRLGLRRRGPSTSPGDQYPRVRSARHR